MYQYLESWEGFWNIIRLRKLKKQFQSFEFKYWRMDIFKI